MSILKRAAHLGTLAPSVNPRKRLESRTDSMDRANVLQVQLSAATASLVAVTKLLYVQIDDRFVNMDHETRRILIPVPWGSRGWKRWELRKWEGEVLRGILTDIAGGKDPVLFYPSAAGWYVNDDWNQDQALTWIRTNGPTLAEWRNGVERRREAMQNYMATRRATTG